MTGITSEAIPATPLDPVTERSPQAPLRVALIGAGKMGAHHARAIGTLSGSRARLVAVADPSAAARRAVVAAAPDVAEFDSLTAVLSAMVVDVVHVCTPPATHVSVARAALNAGCHVYVEKPFSETAADADEILRAAQALGRTVCAGHQLLFEQPARVAAQLAPALGRLVHAESYFSFRTVRRAPGGRTPLRADLQLLDILPHPVYLLLNFLHAAGGSPATLSSLELGDAGTVHALVRRGSVTGHLIVTLEGRPIESYLRLVGTNGSIHADFVRGTVQRLFGPGTSGIDKLLAPYRVASQMLTGTTAALGRRVLKRQRSYPGLAELFDAFYHSIQHGTPSPVSSESIRETVGLCEAIARRLALQEQAPVAPRVRPGARIVLTGGTGFLGRATAAALAARGASVRVLARRQPAAWERVPDVEYAVADLGEGLAASLLADTDVVVHAAAETAGGWDEHQRNSVDATETLVRTAAAAGVRRFIHVSSLAVLARPSRGAINEHTPLEANSRGSGPYVWGKLESEQRAAALGRELGVEVRVVRPGAIVDYTAFDPPGRLGKRVGPFFVAVGSPGDRLGVVDLAFTTNVLAWMATHFDQAPATLNLLDPDLPAKRDLVRRLRQTDPDLKVIWLPWPLLLPLSGLASLLQKALRPKRAAISLRRVFASPRYDTSSVRTLAAVVASTGSVPKAPPAPGPSHHPQ
jgi:predicted dehydrogenase/nucleoside-diphosphate-sugar epimerase